MKIPLTTALLLSCACGLQADLMTNFDTGSLPAGLFLDQPNPTLGSAVLDPINSELDFTAVGNTDMWTTRANAPLAWTAKPTVALGGTWYAETELRLDTPTTANIVSGLTVYGGPDGANAQFSYSLDNWVPANRAVRLQGLGNNNPNIAVPFAGTSVHLRIEITEAVGNDIYNFFYKANLGDAWTQLGGAAIDFQSFTIGNDRVALLQKTGATGGGTAFNYFNVGIAVPEPSSLGLLLLGLTFTLRSRRR